MDKRKLVDILAKFDIPRWTEGKNVSADSVNVQCPFCDDPSNHCGIFYDTELFHCWRCRRKGPFSYLLSVFTNLSLKECEDVIGGSDFEFKEGVLDWIKRKINGKRQEVTEKEERVELPEYFELVTSSTDFPLLFTWMGRRNIVLDTLIQNGCGICRVGKYMNRLVIPVIFEKKVVSFQAVDLTGVAKTKYRSAPGRINDYLYNYDSISSIMIVTEGILDAWRVGNDAVASFGTYLTEKQRDLVLKKKLGVLIFMYDGEAFWSARREVKFFGPYVPVARAVKLPKGEDPDSFGAEGVRRLLDEVKLARNH